MQHSTFAVTFLIIGILIVFNSCATTGSTSDAEEIDRLLVDNPSLTLKDYFRRMSGVRVNDSGGEVRVMVRGTSTLSGDNSPLFIVDGSRIGKSYSAVENAVDIKDIQYIRVLRSSEAMTSYGMEAANGAIVIETKK